jgi:hypothetical protein
LNIYTGNNLKEVHSEEALITKLKTEEDSQQQQLVELTIEINQLAHPTHQI